MTLPFDTCWERVERAELHRQALIKIWNDLKSDDIYSSETEVDENGNGKFFIRTIKRDWLLPASLQLGEMLYQLRSALDSCVYDAAVLEFNQCPPPNDEQWNFPICATPAKFNNLVRRMKKLPDNLRRLLESVQPYSGSIGRSEEIEWDLGLTLGILNDWARIDRHRKLHLVGTAISNGNLSFISPHGSGIESCDFQSGEFLLEHNSEIARFKIRHYVPGTKVLMNAQFTFEIVVDEAPRMSKLQDISVAMILSISGVRELFEQHYGVKR